jgi:general secretion pathway protein G
MHSRLRDSRGFTLIEIMIVIVILGMLAAIVVPKLMGNTDKAKVADAKVQIRNLESALKMYKLDSGVYPTPAVGTIPKNYRDGGYLESTSVPKDPWGNEFLYLSPGEHGDYDLSSYGADGVRGGEKYDADIVSWDLK